MKTPLLKALLAPLGQAFSRQTFLRGAALALALVAALPGTASAGGYSIQLTGSSGAEVTGTNKAFVVSRDAGTFTIALPNTIVTESGTATLDSIQDTSISSWMTGTFGGGAPGNSPASSSSPYVVSFSTNTTDDRTGSIVVNARYILSSNGSYLPMIFRQDITQIGGEGVRTIRFSPNGGTGTAPAAISGTIGSEIELPSAGTLSKNGFLFHGWNRNSSGSGEHFNMNSPYIIEGNATLYAEWRPRGAVVAPPTLAVALDAPGLVWLSSSANGNSPWVGQTFVTHDGNHAARSGPLGHSNSQADAYSMMQTTVEGTGTLKFWYNVSSERSFDYFRFYIDGIQQYTTGSNGLPASGSVPWTQYNGVILTEGTHTLTWLYIKDYSVSAGSDCVWIDQVQWTPTPEPPGPPPVVPILEISPVTVKPVPTVANSLSVSVTSNTTWSAKSSKPTWLTVATGTSDGNDTRTVSWSENIKSSSRSASITFKSGSLKRTLKITQAKATLKITPSKTQKVSAEAGSVNISVDSNSTWHATSNAAWLTVSDPADTTGNGSRTLSYEANPTTKKRTGKVVFTNGSIKRTLTVSQAKGPAVTTMIASGIMTASVSTLYLSAASNSAILGGTLNSVYLGNTLAQQSGTLTLSGTGLPGGELGEVVVAQGDPAPGVPGGRFQEAGEPAVDSHGRVVFKATLEASSGAGGLTGIWAYLDGEGKLITRTGAAAAETAGATFADLGDPVAHPEGTILFPGTVAGGDVTPAGDNAAGAWLVAQSGSAQLVWRQGDAVPGQPGATFEGLTQIVAGQPGGAPAFLATIAGPGIDASSNTGLWSLGAGGTYASIIQTGEAVPDGASTRIVTAIDALPPTGQSRMDTEGGRIAYGLTFSDHAAALCVAEPEGDGFGSDFVARTWDESVPGIDGAAWKAFGSPAVNANGVIAFRATLTTGETGIWLHREQAATLLAKTGGPAPGINGATFTQLENPVLNSDDAVAFIGTAQPSGATPVAGLWVSKSGTTQLLAKQGDPAPGIAGLLGTNSPLDLRFATFRQVALPDVGGPLIVATLANGSAGSPVVVAASAIGQPAGASLQTTEMSGLWRAEENGTLTLLALTGGSVNVRGEHKTIAAIHLLTPRPIVAAQTRSLAPATQNLATRITFTDGTWAIFLAE